MGGLAALVPAFSWLDSTGSLVGLLIPSRVSALCRDGHCRGARQHGGRTSCRPSRIAQFSALRACRPCRSQCAARSRLCRGGAAFRQFRSAHSQLPHPPERFPDSGRADVADHGYAILNAVGCPSSGSACGCRRRNGDHGRRGCSVHGVGRMVDVFFPGWRSMVAAFCLNLLGDGLRDMVDLGPHMLRA